MTMTVDRQDFRLFPGDIALNCAPNENGDPAELVRPERFGVVLLMEPTAVPGAVSKKLSG